MNRWAIALIGLMFSCSISSKTESLTGSQGLVFEGTITADNGRPVPGAKIRIVDRFGKTTNHVLSDLKGFYRFPWVLASNAEARTLGLEISHMLFQPVRLKDGLSGAILGSPALTNLAPTTPSFGISMFRATRCTRLLPIPVPGSGPVGPCWSPKSSMTRPTATTTSPSLTAQTMI